MESNQDLEQRAKVAEEKLVILEKKISQLEMNAKNESNSAFANSEEYENLKSENEELKVTLAKKDYRINHLIRALETAEKTKEEIDKLKYRINILLRSLERAEGRSSVEVVAPKIETVSLNENDPICNVDLRVGQIVKAWKHEEADKLICEEIDLGEGSVRKIASGLMQFYKPEDIVGKRVVIVANLKEKALKGYPSHGMVLCACSEDHSQVEIVEPPKSAAIGSRILPALSFDVKECTEINLNKKNNSWLAASPELLVNMTGNAVYKNIPLEVNGEYCTIPSLRNVHLS
ncbi:hypothetical protein WA158_001706 [Blastocystis sp. Blastoise]